MISVITLTRNNFDELNATLNSLQDVPGIECIVINAGECEKTLEMLKQWQTRSNVQIINEKDQGIADGFNKGARLARGEAIAYLNSGDLLLNKNYYSEAEAILNERPEISFVHSNLLFNDQVAGHLTMRPSFSSLGRGQPFLHPTMVMRKSVFNEIGYFDISYRIGMDFEFICRLEKVGKKGFYMDLPPVVQMDGGGISYLAEGNSISECRRALNQNHMFNFGNCWGFAVRSVFYFIRRLLLVMRLDFGLKWLKAKKYKA